MHAHRVENLHERAGIAVDRTPRDHGHDHAERADVKHENTPDNAVRGLRDGGARIFGFARGDADELSATEAKHHHDQRHQQAGPRAVRIARHQAVGQESAVNGEPVGERRANTRSCRHVRDDHIQTAENHGKHGHDLDDGEPEFKFAELVHAHKIQRRDGHQEHRRRHPLRNVREPVIHERANHSQLHHGHQHIVEPVIPAGNKARTLRPVLRGIVAECARLRILDRHFGQCAHDQENRQTADQIGEQNGRTRQLNRFAGTVEQAGADRTTQCDQLNMTILQRLAQRRRNRHIVGFARFLRNDCVAHECFLFLGASAIFGNIRQIQQKFGDLVILRSAVVVGDAPMVFGMARLPRL